MPAPSNAGVVGSGTGLVAPNGPAASSTEYGRSTVPPEPMVASNA